MEDLTPKLLDKIQQSFKTEFESDSKIKAIYESVKNNTATHAELNSFAERTGDILANSFKINLSSEVLPDGKMYYNIADRILNTTLKNNYSLVTDVATQVQDSINKTWGIGLKSTAPVINQDKIDGLVNRISSEDVFDDVAWILAEPVTNFTMSVVDEFIRSDLDFKAASGLTVKATRTVVGHCCEWCASLAGTYDYPDKLPPDFFKRHKFCRCTIETFNADNKTIKYFKFKAKEPSDATTEKKESRKLIGLESDVQGQRTLSE